MYYFKNKKKKTKGKKMYVAQQRVYLTTKKEFFKFIAKQTDAFTVLNFGA